MDPLNTFCPNMDCPARGHTQQGNIKIHCRTRKRYRCTVCRKTFSHRTGTPFLGLRTDINLITLVLTLIAYGCPIPAIEAAFGYQRRTVRAWLKRAGKHARAVHEHLVLQPRAQDHIQADEIYVKTQRGRRYLAMAIAVPTRLWLGAQIGASRGAELLGALAGQIRACCSLGPLLLVTDGVSTYAKVFKRAFRDALRTGRVGRPRLVLWPALVIGQVVKKHRRRRLVEVVHRLVHGSAPLLRDLLKQTGSQVLNTSYIERLNATFRERLRILTRRTRGLARLEGMLEAGVWLLGAIYNFCTYHASLSLADGTPRTPAMAAGIVADCWTVGALLWYQVPPPRWVPPKRRGRRPKALQELIDRWAA